MAAPSPLGSARGSAVISGLQIGIVEHSPATTHQPDLKLGDRIVVRYKKEEIEMRFICYAKIDDIDKLCGRVIHELREDTAAQEFTRSLITQIELVQEDFPPTAIHMQELRRYLHAKQKDALGLYTTAGTGSSTPTFTERAVETAPKDAGCCDDCSCIIA